MSSNNLARNSMGVVPTPAMAESVSLPIFTGNDPKLTVSDFIFRVEQLKSINNWTSIQTAAKAVTAFSGPAADWRRLKDSEEEAGVLEDWEALKKGLEQEYAIGHTPQQAWEAKTRMKMATNGKERPKDFYKRCKLLIIDLDPDHAIKPKALALTTPESVPQEVRENAWVKSMVEELNTLKKKMKAKLSTDVLGMFMSGIPSNLRKLASLKTKDTLDNEEYVAVIERLWETENMNKAVAAIQNRGRSKSRDGKNRQRRRSNSGNRDVKTMRGRQIRKDGKWRCSWCLEWTDTEGHVSRNCPQRLAGKPRAQKDKAKDSSPKERSVNAVSKKEPEPMNVDQGEEVDQMDWYAGTLGFESSKDLDQYLKDA